MEKCKIAFAGGRLLGLEVLHWLSLQDCFEIIAVCPISNDDDPEYYCRMIELVKEKNLFLCDIQDFKNFKVDIGLSVNYNKIIRSDLLKHCVKGFYNVHHSYNLRLRGRNVATHAILNTLKEPVFYHGTTLHKMVPELDAGGIVASESIPIDNDDTAFTLFKKADSLALSLIKVWIPRIAFEKIFLYNPPTENVYMYKNVDLPERLINREMTCEQIDTYIRAFDFPGKEPAYVMEKNKKIHLVYRERDSYKYEYRIDKNTYYTDIEY